MRYESEASVVVRSVSKDFVVRDSDTRPAGRLVRRKGNLKVRALNDVSFVLRRGESVGILGRNGSGKSTLLRIISGGERATEGKVLASATPTLLGVSAALQPHLSGAQNIRIGCLAMGFSPSEVRDLFPRISEFADLGQDLLRPMNTYSSGMSARLTFAISTSVHPDILLIDEALSTGDAAFTSRAKSMMRSLMDAAGTIVLVSHNATQVKEFCDRAIWLHEGEIVADGPVDSVAPDYAKWALRIGRQNYEGAASILDGYRERYVSPKILFADEHDGLEWPDPLS